MSPTPDALVDHFREIYRERMRGLPIVNDRLDVAAIGFTDYEEHRLGVLVTPWFMNLVLLPGTDAWADAGQGTMHRLAFPSGPCDFTVTHDETLGTYLTAVLFSTVADFPDQDTTLAVAGEIMATLFVEPDEQRREGRRISRRGLLTGLGNS